MFHVAHNMLHVVTGETNWEWEKSCCSTIRTMRYLGVSFDKSL
jgi:hypothetical protein